MTVQGGLGVLLQREGFTSLKFWTVVVLAVVLLLAWVVLIRITCANARWLPHHIAVMPGSSEPRLQWKHEVLQDLMRRLFDNMGRLLEGAGAAGRAAASQLSVRATGMVVKLFVAHYKFHVAEQLVSGMASRGRVLATWMVCVPLIFTAGLFITAGDNSLLTIGIVGSSVLIICLGKCTWDMQRYIAQRGVVDLLTMISIDFIKFTLSSTRSDASGWKAAHVSSVPRHIAVRCQRMPPVRVRALQRSVLHQQQRRHRQLAGRQGHVSDQHEPHHVDGRLLRSGKRRGIKLAVDERSDRRGDVPWIRDRERPRREPVPRHVVRVRPAAAFPVAQLRTRRLLDICDLRRERRQRIHHPGARLLRRSHHELECRYELGDFDASRESSKIEVMHMQTALRNFQKTASKSLEQAYLALVLGLITLVCGYLATGATMAFTTLMLAALSASVVSYSNSSSHLRSVRGSLRSMLQKVFEEVHQTTSIVDVKKEAFVADAFRVLHETLHTPQSTTANDLTEVIVEV